MDYERGKYAIESAIDAVEAHPDKYAEIASRVRENFTKKVCSRDR